jgi:hypothetical protein
MQVMGFGQLAAKPANNSKTMANESGWILTRHAPPGLLKDLTRTSKIIGHPSVFGKVVQLSYKGNESRFVKKIMNFNPLTNTSRSHIFSTEIKIGSLPSIGRVGPRIVAYRLTPFGGEYIMDNVKLGMENSRIVSMANLGKRFNPKILEAIVKTVKEFQKITKGQHGDLHGDNILLVQPKEASVYIRIIDYGAHRTLKELKKIGPILKKHHGMNVYKPGQVGQHFVYNKNWLKKVTSS